jgi:hypothetical protein
MNIALKQHFKIEYIPAAKRKSTGQCIPATLAPRLVFATRGWSSFVVCSQSDACCMFFLTTDDSQHHVLSVYYYSNPQQGEQERYMYVKRKRELERTVKKKRQG